MDKSSLIEILKGRYEYEQFRRNNFDNVIGLPITILALLIGGWSAFVFQVEGSWTFLKSGSSVCVLTIGISIFYLVKVFYGFGRKYDVLPTAKIIKAHYDKLIEYHRGLNPNANSVELQEQVNISFDEDLAKWYTDSSDLNCTINDQRAEFLHRSKLWLILSLFIIFMLVIYQIITA